MAHFHITPGTPSLNLPASRKGQFSFTVTNALGRAARVQASVVPEAGAKPEWLSIEGAAERDLGPTETQTFIVQVQVPQDVPPGEQRFRLLVASVARPDDDYDTSPAVAFTIPAAQAHPPFPWWIVIVAGAALVIIVGGILLFLAFQKPGLGHSCDPAKANCQSGLTCPAVDGGASVCLGNEGTACKAGTDCLTNECANGKCAQKPPGANCAADTDCPSTQKCIQTRPGIKTCLLKGGQSCTEDWMCASWCIEAKHQCAPENGACKADTDCPSTNFVCSSGTCKVVLGKPCQQHTDCQSNNCQDRSCARCITIDPCPRNSFCQGNQCVSGGIQQFPRYRELMPVQPLPPRLHF